MQTIQTPTKLSDIPSSDEVRFIPAEFIEYIWHDIEPLIQKALDETFNVEDMNDVKSQILAKKYGLYIFLPDALEAVCVCDVLSSKEGDIFRILYAASDTQGIFDWEIALEKFLGLAKSLGCFRFEILGRKGWERKFKDLGFKLSYVTIARDLR